MIEDGSFERYFFEHPIVKSALEQRVLSQRIVMDIDSPFMLKEPPYHNEKR